MTTTEHPVARCYDCPFLEKEDWATEDDSGTDYKDCALGGMPGPAYKHRNDLYGTESPSWCKLREGDVLVKLTVRKREDRMIDDDKTLRRETVSKALATPEGIDAVLRIIDLELRLREDCNDHEAADGLQEAVGALLEACGAWPLHG